MEQTGHGAILCIRDVVKKSQWNMCNLPQSCSSFKYKTQALNISEKHLPFRKRQFISPTKGEIKHRSNTGQITSQRESKRGLDYAANILKFLTVSTL